MTYTRAAPVESATYHHWVLHAAGVGSSPWAMVNSMGSSVASNAWPLANLALYIPFFVNETLTVYEAGIGTGGTAGGNYDIGVYDAAGTRLVSSGTQGRSASVWEVAPLTDTELSPGWYYMAMSADGTNNYSGTVPAAGLCEAVGICEQTSAFVLPATATLSRTTRALIPNITLAVRSVAI